MKKKILSIWLAFIIFVLSCDWNGVTVQAATQTFTLTQAKSMALGESSEYAALENKMALTKVQYDQAIKKLKLKEKNQRTFRWSPLLSFKLPEQPALTDEFEYAYKPIELQSEIDKLNHEKADCVYSVYEKTELEFIKVYVLQEKIAFNEERVENYQTTLEKNKQRLAIGQANQTDVDAIQKKLDTIESTLASDKRNFEAEKEKLSQMVGIDLSVSYRFSSPFADASLDRGMMQDIIDYTLEYDDSYYKAQTNTENARITLDTNYRLMKEQYGSDMDMIDSFIQQARNGKKLDSAAFKLRYNDFLEKVDQPWRGSFRILFIRIPKEWIKGAIDGVRYVEDEPYALYEAAIEYQNLKKEQETLKQDLTAKVKDYYENYVSTRNASETLKKNIQDKKKELQKAKLKNTMGEMTYEEYAQVQEEYDNLQTDYLDAQAAYSQTLYSFDRLTCGLISSYISGTSTVLSTAEGGQSYVVENEGEGVYYYIHSLVSDNMFEFGISVSENSDVEITDYELWIDGVQIGERTPKDKTIRHLTLDIKEESGSFVRLYNGEDFIDDCEFDPSEYSGKLIVVKGYTVAKDEDTLVGNYKTQTDSMGMFLLTIEPEADELAVSYNIKDKNGNYLISEDKISVKDTFKYLAMAESSLSDLTICFYGKDGDLLYEAEFDTTDQTIHKLTE